jgi:hypothetical protein
VGESFTNAADRRPTTQTVTSWHSTGRQAIGVVLSVAGLAASALLAPNRIALAQSGRSGAGIPGVAYTIRVSSQPRSGAGPSSGAIDSAQSYVGHGVFAANRGRLDIVEGSAEPAFAKGDYLLFDTTEIVVVHPRTRDFTIVHRDSTLTDLDRLSALGVKVTLSDVKVQLDSLGPSDTVAGFETTHYRMTTAFDMSVEAASMLQRLGTESVTDYWVAMVPGLPNNPLLRANGVPGGPGMGGMFHDLSRRVDSASARMGQAVALRSRTVSRLIEGPGSSTTVEQRSQVSDIARRIVDESLLIVPAGYVYQGAPGASGDTASDAGAKWRRPPGAPR